LWNDYLEVTKMKVRNASEAVILGAALSVVVFVMSAEAGISGSKHDFSGAGWSGGRLCQPCHAPHSADTSVSTPLWNHELTTAEFTLYDSDTFDANEGTLLLALIDTNLKSMHPIGLIFDTDLSGIDQGLYDPAATPSGLGGTIQQDMLRADRLGCGSCHDVHNTSGISPLLRKDNNGSLLCLTCHNK
jgi:predicted CXXCH cytochrome family protein